LKEAIDCALSIYPRPQLHQLAANRIEILLKVPHPLVRVASFQCLSQVAQINKSLLTPHQKAIIDAIGNQDIVGKVKKA
jgi:hypothetical protein